MLAKRPLLSLTLALLVLGLCSGTAWFAYSRYLRSVRVALIGFRDSDWALWREAAADTTYTLHRYERDGLTEVPLSHYQVVLIRAMGYRPDEAERAALATARAAGVRIMMLGAISDVAADQDNVDGELRERIEAYLRHGGERNLRSLLHLLARELSGREVAVPPVVERPQQGFFHLGEDNLFACLDEFEAYLAEARPHLAPDAPRLALLGPFLDPLSMPERGPVDALIRAFESQGVRVYPLFGREAFDRVPETEPDLAILFPHGRIAGDNRGPEQLAAWNIPCLSALHLMADQQEWWDDPRGMSAGLLSQSITMPELDGVLEPRAISTMEPNPEGLRVRTALPGNLERYVARVVRWLKLQRTPNAEKRVAIVYYKAPGASALAAAGLEVAPALYHTLQRLEAEGYDLGDALPDSPEALYEQIQRQGRTVGQWAVGAFEQFLDEARPERIPVEQYAQWFQQTLSPRRQQELIDRWGPPPGQPMAVEQDGQRWLLVSRIRLGNVVIMPQPTAGVIGSDEVATVHGTGEPPPHFYLGAYLWARHGFQADALIHFGTHGSLEFTYGKSAALSEDCWPHILIGDLPHIYPYIINNVGEALVAKRRSSAAIVSHLTPPFTDAGLYGDLEYLHERIHEFEYSEEAALRYELRRTITWLVQDLELSTDLGLEGSDAEDFLLEEAQILTLHDYLHELKDRHIPDGLHVIGRPYCESQVRDTAAAMLGSRGWETVQSLLAGRVAAEDDLVEERSVWMRGLLDAVREGRLTAEQLPAPAASDLPAATQDTHPPAPPGTRTEPAGKGPEITERETAEQEPAEPETGTPESGEPENQDPTAEQEGLAQRVRSVWDAERIGPKWAGTDPELQESFRTLLAAAAEHAAALQASPQAELDGVVNALAGGYLAPSSGSDVLRNPSAAPTGRNLYSISAEQTPSEEAWRVGQQMARAILAQHVVQEGRYPRRVAVTLWGGEFIRTRGATLAQILYLMGARPQRDARGTVYDVEIIPAEELGRPRIDVVVQTSGQFRDAAASRVRLIDQAVQRIADQQDEPYPNFVRENTQQAEEDLKQQGYAPRDARQWATARVFGATGNASYGTGIMGLVERGDTWESEAEIAERYLANMSGVYRGDGVWGTPAPGLFQTQLAGAEIVVQPRSSNTWGPLSLDHVYEFMGGISLAIRATTGSDPRGYFSDLRDPSRPRAATAAAAIREEARTQVWNPRFIAGMQREGPSAAAALTENVRNLYGWNVMQPAVIGDAMWEETFQVYIEDKHDLELQAYFEEVHPAALQDMTAIMLETIRKGLWEPSPATVQRLAELHAELVARHGAGCSYETCGNASLHEFLTGVLQAPGAELAGNVLDDYQSQLAAALTSARPLPEVTGMELEERRDTRETASAPAQPLATALLAAWIVAAAALIVLTGLARPAKLAA